MAAGAATSELRDEVAARDWYHTLELAPGLVTPGYFDHRELAPKLPFPSSLAGKRCLDVGTFDGFWAFELEKRGSENVVAADILDPMRWDWPAGTKPETIDAIARRKDQGRGFEVAARALGSKVQREELSVYDLDPDVHGMFDFVFMGSILLHLRDPILALEKAGAVCSGQLLSVDAIDPLLTAMHPRRPIALLEAEGRPWWWKPNLKGYEQMIRSSGLKVVTGPKTCLIPPGGELRQDKVDLRQLRHYDGRVEFLRRKVGDAHAYVLAQP